MSPGFGALVALPNYKVPAGIESYSTNICVGCGAEIIGEPKYLNGEPYCSLCSK